jgi:hypothetical protein
MKWMRKGILRTLALTGVIAAAGAAAQAQAGFAVRVGPAAVYDNYIPPCPGEGYVWTPAYYSGSVRVPGRWVFRHPYRFEHREYHFDRHDGWRDRGWDHGRR